MRGTLIVAGHEFSRPNAAFAALNILAFRDSKPSKESALPQVKLTVVSMIAGEDRYLSDWLTFHAAIGVDRFILYLNENEDDCVQRVGQLVREIKGFYAQIVLVHWPDLTWPLGKLNRPHGNPRRARPSLQELAFRHAFKYYSGFTDYVLKIDVDEFVYRTDFEVSGVGIGPLLTFRGTYPIRGYNFGSNGELAYRSGPVPCRFTRRESNKSWTKSIAHAESVHEFGFAHHFTGPQASDDLPLMVNHYRLKSRDEYQANKVRTRGYMAQKYSTEAFEAWDTGLNEVVDDAACCVYRRVSE